MITKEKINIIQEQLKKEEESLLQQITAVGSKNPAVSGDFEPTMPSYGDSEEDTINESVDLDRNIAVESKLEERIEEVRAALLRIKQGTFGSCTACGAPIEENRLQSMPTARNCSNCLQ
jgi:RNA polymerase-binding transcription factor DksA